MNKTLIIFLLMISQMIFSQQKPTNASTIENAITQKEKLTKSSLVKNINFTNIGLF
jgi:hypothetical protein